MTHAAVLEAARALLVEGGVGALTMRALACRLNVTPNTLYSHVESKTQLLDDLLDDLLAAVAVPRLDDPDPLGAIAGLMASTYAVLTAHPDLVPVFLERQGARGPNAVRLGELMDGLLEREGVRGRAGVDARRVLIVHTIGFAALTTSSLGSGEPKPPSGAASRRNFMRSLGWLLAGIAADPGAVSTPGRARTRKL